MKTLDEVITELEDEGVFPDALHYLQTYRADKLEWEQTRQANEERYQEAVKNCERAENKFIARLKELDIGTLNDPLTWDELKTMEGTPVWVERPEWKEWLLVSEIDEDKCEIYLRDKWGNGISVNGRNIGYWRAYRKERDDR